MGYWGRDKTASTYDLVEPMNFLYVNVVKATDLPVMDISGSLDPYVEVKVGNYKGVTNHLEKNQHPEWHKVFAFSKERLQSNLIEVTVKDKDIGKDDFVGRVMFDVVDVPVRMPPDSPLAPQWYKLENKKGEKISHGELMLAVWTFFFFTNIG
ncbi:C2 calcium/lipid-binding plant phosphoribosyltransferase family protein [Abeliophyllum distichum]|uniref:C2 calcium/lipid-binding plant phosphoribosyltransferase family protein n=1 Tax=Abeliophyllum distichum TaxID=126358 RepID=A0ABD1RQK7_9LAMI